MDARPETGFVERLLDLVAEGREALALSSLVAGYQRRQFVVIVRAAKTETQVFQLRLHIVETEPVG